MLARLSRHLSVLTPALLGGLLWMGLPGAAEAGDWKHGRGHGHREHRYEKHNKHYEHHGKHHHDRRAYSRGWSGYRHYPAWHGGYRGHRQPRYYYYYPAPVAVGVYFDEPCGRSYESWDGFSHHVHRHHGVAFVDLPDLLVQTNFGFVFHR